jgi:SAM-dependent methyltransferase
MKYSKGLLYVLLLLSIFLVVIWYYKRPHTEGFLQTERFVVKTDADIYDDFYTAIYDDLMLPKKRVDTEIELILQTIQPDKTYSVLLDVGTGTGTFLHGLLQKGYRAYGIDKSPAMIETAQQKYPELEIKNHDVLDPMTYDRGLFTHIFCMDFTIYEIADKTKFFKNCYYWLQNNGYLVVHIADREKFNTITPAAAPAVAPAERVTKTNIEFPDYVYVSEWMVGKTREVLHKENFTDKETQHIRQNERTLYMDSKADILTAAQIAGFVSRGSMATHDSAQEIIIFERTC